MPDEATLTRKLLIVEDDDILRGRLARAFRERGFDVREAADGEDASALAARELPEYALVDLRLPRTSGLEMVKALVALDPGMIIVVLTGYGSIATALEAMRSGATHYLTKPVDVDEIIAGFGRAKKWDGDAPPPSGTTPSLARVEWEHVNRVLADCGGNVSKAARLLGIHRRSLQRKLAKFPVSH